MTMANATKTPSGEDWLTVREACALVGVSPATLRRWSDNGEVTTFTTPGGHRRFARSAIQALLPDSVGEAVDGEAPAGSAAPAGDGDRVLPGLLALAAHARQVPSATREAFADDLAALEPSEATISVRTCHRAEIYVVRGEDGGPLLPEPPPGTRRLEGIDAVRHVIGVACGLDSAVLGENQVLHQLRETLKGRRAEKRRLDPALDRLFQVSLNAGRRARSWLNGTHRSLADVALERVAQRVGDPEGRPLLVVGAGVMGRLAARAAARRGAKVVVTSRTPARAEALAREVGGQTAPFEGDGVLPRVDGALVALCGAWNVGEEDARGLAGNGTVVVDLSSPAAVTEALQARLEDRFVSTDDLAWESGFEPQGKLRKRLEELVGESGEAYRRWLGTRNSVPAIRAIGESAEEKRREELEWLLRRLPDVAEKDRALIEQMSNRLVAAILHGPRSALNADDSGELARAARDLFAT
jgi:glutamyl-tRNA reductase